MMMSRRSTSYAGAGGDARMSRRYSHYPAPAVDNNNDRFYRGSRRQPVKLLSSKSFSELREDASTLLLDESGEERRDWRDPPTIRQQSPQVKMLERMKKDHVIWTSKEENRRRRTILLNKQYAGRYGFTLQTYGIRRHPLGLQKSTSLIETCRTTTSSSSSLPNIGINFPLPSVRASRTSLVPSDMTRLSLPVDVSRPPHTQLLTYVDYVEMNSPAHLSGLRPGDVILSINGQNMENADHNFIVNFIVRSKRSLRIVVMFEDCVRKVELHVKCLKLKQVLADKMFEFRNLCIEEQEILNKYNKSDASIPDLDEDSGNERHQSDCDGDTESSFSSLSPSPSSISRDKVRSSSFSSIVVPTSTRTSSSSSSLFQPTFSTNHNLSSVSLLGSTNQSPLSSSSSFCVASNLSSSSLLPDQHHSSSSSLFDELHHSLEDRPRTKEIIHEEDEFTHL